MEWHNKLALSSRRQADYAWQVLALVLAWAKERGKIAVNPCERGGRLYRGSRVDKIWTDDDEAAFVRTAPVHLRLPLLLALWTGQRQGDLLRLPHIPILVNDYAATNHTRRDRHRSGKIRVSQAI
jgi:integrase